MQKLIPVIALKGLVGSGKSTAAKYLEGKGYRTISFASPLKLMLKSFGLTHAQLYGDQKEVPCDLLCGRTPRDAMQLLGTEWGRALHPDLWTSYWRRHAETVMNDDGDLVVVDDCRFDNEAKVVRELGGVVIEIVPPAAVDDEDGTVASPTTGIVGHVSEAQDFDPDIIVVNDKAKGVGALHAGIDEAISVLLQDAYDEAA
jgi:hypothetical protein